MHLSFYHLLIFLFLSLSIILIIATELEPTSDEITNETESLLSKEEQGGDDGIRTKKGSKKEGLFSNASIYFNFFSLLLKLY